jgi:hypothetical protein
MTSTLTVHGVTPAARRLLEELRAELAIRGHLVTVDHGDDPPALAGARRPPPEPPMPAHRALHETIGTGLATTAGRAVFVTTAPLSWYPRDAPGS